MDRPLIVRGRYVITGAGPDDPVHTDGAVVVEGGAVVAVGPWPEIRARHPDAEVIGSDRVAVLPGLVNAHHHSHAVSTVQHGVSDDLLEPWILALSRQRPGEARLDTLISAARLLRTGVTSVVELYSAIGGAEAYADGVGRALQAYDESGIRVAFAPGVRTRSRLVHGGPDEDRRFLGSLPEALRARTAAGPGGPRPTEEEYLAIVEEAFARYRDHPRVDVWFGPPGPQWVSDELMQRIAERAADLDTGIQTHVDESIYEMLMGPKFYGTHCILHLRDLGVLGPRFSIAHGVWLTEPEIEAMAASGAGISHNPSSNLRLRSGIAPLNALLAAGVTIGLGMDGTTLDDDEDMFGEMRLALRLHRTPRLGLPAPTPAELFHLATGGGAKLLRREASLGRLAPGFRADLVLVDLDRITWPWTAPEVDPRELVLLRARAGDVETVLIDGEVVLREGEPTRFDVAAAAAELAARLESTPFPAAQARLVAELTPRIEAWYRSWEVPPLDPYIAYNSKR